MLEMLMQWYRRRFSDPEAIALLVILVAGFGIIFFFSGLLAPLLVAIVLAYLLEWPTVRLQSIGCSRRWATSIVLVVFVGILLLMAFVVLPIAWQQGIYLIRDMPGMLNKLSDFAATLPRRYPALMDAGIIDAMAENMRSRMLTMGDSVVKISLASLVGLLTIAVYLVLVPLMVFFLLKDKEQMDVGETAYRFENEKSVVLVIGVNGVGKTTSVGKLAGKLKDQGKKVVLAAADTFRAAAGTQLQEWANRAGVEMIGGQEGADPGAIVYDAVAAAKARNADVLLCDTAGRLHNKKNLMEELRKINRILEKEYPDAFRETLVVLDATTGQNALAQAREFADVADITGIILTKMDGTAKGGIAVAIHSELGIPVKYIGVGETIEDLQKFDSNQFVNALFDVQEDKSSPRP